MLTESERRTLLLLVAQSLDAYLKGSAPPEPAALTPSLEEDRGAFVTWTAKGALRGCIGHIVPVGPLWVSVRRLAVSAASEDPRFPPIEPAELPGLEVDISALTPLKLISRWTEIEVGKHGLWIQKRGRAGVLLPQVATSRGWDVKEFLRHTCLKAGLREDDWESGAEISIFSAEVFGDEVVKILIPGYVEKADSRE
jgi:AmmeMemoRadiSam system protein A